MTGKKELQKAERIFIADSGRKFYQKDPDKDLHTQYGYIRSEDIKNARPGDKLETNKGVGLFLVEPKFLDHYSKIKRLAQIIPLKDIGSIIAGTGITRDSIVLDAGSGSGGLACFLASLVKKMYTYDIRDDHLEIIKKNKDYLGLSNLHIVKGDIYQKIKQNNVDLIILDVPEPWKALNTAVDALKIGGYIVSYSPHIPQTVDFVNTVREYDNFLYIKTIEVNEREWEIDGRKVRPKTSRMGHSGFLSFARLVSN
ncbi:MAG: tRNA (adenine-N1)-methyltransferase [Candidatus Woesearchaeota archaeon]